MCYKKLNKVSNKSFITGYVTLKVIKGNMLYICISFFFIVPSAKVLNLKYL